MTEARIGLGPIGSQAAFVLCVGLALLSGCKDENKFAAPPPPQVGVAHPVQQKVRSYLEGTGNTVAVNQIDLVARVKGFLSAIEYQDGAAAARGQTLFVIEQAPYQAQLQQAQASLQIAQASLAQTQAEFDRQQTLVRQNVTSQSNLDQARAARDTAQGNVQNAQGGVTIAAINLGYTNVAAPFDGVVTQHLASVGALVGASGDTKLATLVQLKPIYAAFNVSEQDVLRIRAALKARRLTQADFDRIPIEVGLMDEQGYPHAGVLQYIAPELDPATGTILVRGVFDNADRGLLPGLFVRVRVPITEQPQTALLVPRPHPRQQPGRPLRAGGERPGRGGAAERQARGAVRRAARGRERAQAGRPGDRHGRRTRRAGAQGGAHRHRAGGQVSARSGRR